MQKIDKGLDMPKARAGRHRLHPWAEMNVGDSLFFADPRRRSGILATAKRWASRNAPEMDFATRTDGSGFRLWRVK